MTHSPRMVKLGAGLALMAAALLMAGCAAAYVTPIKPPPGFAFAQISAPLTPNFDNTSNDPSLIKYSESKTYYVHDWILTGISIAWDEADVAAAAHRGGIGKVSYADYSFLNVLGFYATFTVHVYGEPMKAPTKGSDDTSPGPAEWEVQP